MIDLNDWIAFDSTCQQLLLSFTRLKRDNYMSSKIISSSFCSSSYYQPTSFTRPRQLSWQSRWWRLDQPTLWIFIFRSDPKFRTMYLSFAFLHHHQVVVCDLEDELMGLGHIFEAETWLSRILDEYFHSFVGELFPTVNIRIVFWCFFDLGSRSILLGLHLRGYQYYI